MHRGEEDQTVENPADGAPPLVAAPRHLRRRRLHGEIPDALLVPGAEPVPLSGGHSVPEENPVPGEDPAPGEEDPVSEERPVSREHPLPQEHASSDEHGLSDGRPATAEPDVELAVDDEEAAYRRKRLAALLAVIFVALSVPALILVLLLLG
jgi:hypothetical protein